MRWTHLFAAGFALAWLVPNHYFPWPAAWPDGLAIGLLAMALLCQRGSARLARAWAAFGAIALFMVLAQMLVGHIHFAGDGWMAALYLLVFLASIGLGSHLNDRVHQPAEGTGLAPVMVAMLACAVVSVGIALVQATGALSLGIWGVELPPRERPFSNVAQANHLASICFLGLCSLGWLHQQRRLRTGVFMSAAGYLLWGLAMTSSRTGWLMVFALVVWGAFVSWRNAAVLRPRGFVALGLMLIVFVLAWPEVNVLLLLSGGRDPQELQGAGTRHLHWQTMMRALGEEPLWGYGWQQVSLAQLRVAADLPAVGEYVEHSHNVVLDLLVWNGLPVGAVLVLLSFGWLFVRAWRHREPGTWWLMAAPMGLLIHACLEFPLEFAYFMIPFGLFVGAVHAAEAATPAVRVPMPAVRLAGGFLLVAVFCVGADYLRAEQGHRLLRLESARIGAPGLSTPPPELKILTQLAAFQRFAHTEARPGMAAADLRRMREVSERFAYPPALFRYALAQGLNGDARGAELTLTRLCRIHAVARCNEAREAWRGLQQRYPVLEGVAAP